MNLGPLKKRKYDKSHAEIIWRMRQYFENELRKAKRIKLSHVLERTAAATEVSKNIIYKIKSTEDPENWTIQPDAHIGVQRERSVPENFDILVLQTVRLLFLQKN